MASKNQDGDFEKVELQDPKSVVDRIPASSGYDSTLAQNADLLQNTLAAQSEPTGSPLDPNFIEANRSQAKASLKDTLSIFKTHQDQRGTVPEQQSGSSGSTWTEHPMLAAADNPYIPFRGQWPATSKEVERDNAPGELNDLDSKLLAEWNEEHSKAHASAQKGLITFYQNHGIPGASQGLDKGIYHLFRDHEAAHKSGLSPCKDKACAAARKEAEDNNREFTVKDFEKGHGKVIDKKRKDITERLRLQTDIVQKEFPHAKGVMAPYVPVTPEEWKSKPNFQYQSNLGLLSQHLRVPRAAITAGLYMLSGRGRQVTRESALRQASSLLGELGVEKTSKSGISPITPADVSSVDPDKVYELGQAEKEAKGMKYKTSKIVTALKLDSARDSMASYLTSGDVGNSVVSKVNAIAGLLRKVRGSVNGIDPSTLKTYETNLTQKVKAGKSQENIQKFTANQVNRIAAARQAAEDVSKASDIKESSQDTSVQDALSRLTQLSQTDWAVAGTGKETAARNSIGLDDPQGARRTGVDRRVARASAGARIPQVLYELATHINDATRLSRITGQPARDLQAIADAARAEYNPDIHGVYSRDIERQDSSQAILPSEAAEYEAVAKKMKVPKKVRDATTKTPTILSKSDLERNRNIHAAKALSAATGGVAIDPIAYTHNITRIQASETSPSGVARVQAGAASRGALSADESRAGDEDSGQSGRRRRLGNSRQLG